jgi:hypothetical protein
MKLVCYGLLSFVLLACESIQVKEVTKVSYADTVTEADITDTIAEPPPADQSVLHLNNGVKWKADAKTLANVSLLKSVVADAIKQHPVNYGLAATELQNGLDKMITECSMKGPDHEALHQWLLPLVKKVNALKEASGDKAAATMNEIKLQIDLFDQYFV